MHAWSGGVCAFCASGDLTLVVDFGEVALAGAFLRAEQIAGEVKYPLRLCYCNACFAVQVIDVVPPTVLFADYFYFSSSIRTLSEHFKAYATEIAGRFIRGDESAALEIGCNDGVLLKPLADLGIKRVVGVDPASNVVQSIKDPRLAVVNQYFGEALVPLLLKTFGQFDVVMANNVFAHIADITGATRAVRSVLKPDGVFVFEVHYLGKLISELQYDMIYHEHLYYYSVLSAINHFWRHDMTVFDVQPVNIHAGSMRFYVCKRESRHAAMVSERVAKYCTEERALGFDHFSSMAQFSSRLQEHRRSLMGLLTRLRQKGSRIAGYGASGRANTVLQYCGIGSNELDFMIDDAPAKQGFYTPGSHLEIRPSSVLNEPRAPDHLLVFAWSFLAEIQRRNEKYLTGGGRLIVPLPEVRVV